VEEAAVVTELRVLQAAVEGDASPRLPRWLSKEALSGGLAILALLSTYLDSGLSARRVNRPCRRFRDQHSRTNTGK
jgi:hypothetical protein